MADGRDVILSGGRRPKSKDPVRRQQETLPRAVCGVCPHACALAEGRRGICRARIARDGAVVDENYGRVTSLALDPVEKKPLARFRPGSHVLSLGSYGCNLRCPFCQNASIACAGPDDVAWRDLSPERAVELAVKAADRGCVGLAFTYNEPLVGYEYVRDTARLAHEVGLVNVLVSNGMVNPGRCPSCSGSSTPRTSTSRATRPRSTRWRAAASMPSSAPSRRSPPTRPAISR